MASYGSWAGPGPSYFRVGIDFKTVSQNEASATLQVRRWVEVTTTTTFGGTVLATSWAGNVTLYESGTYADSGWVSLGSKNYGTGTSQSASAQYTSSSTGTTHYSGVSATGYPTKPTWTPDAPTIGTNTRNSDNKNTITWTLPSTAGTNHARQYASISIQRSVDGGSYSTIKTGLSKTATSYSDTSTSADHSYAYKVVGVNSAGSTASSASNTTYNTPKAPTSISLARLSSGTSVGITIGNTANTASGLDIQRSTDRSTWTALSSLSGLVTYTTDEPGGGTYYYRVRNTRGSLTSDWIVSDAVVTVIAPNPPTLVSPAAGAIISKSQAGIVFSWTHNPIDGSAQTAALLSYSTNNGSSWTDVAISGDSKTYTLTNNFATNASVLWKIKTKGAATSGGSGSGYSEYSTSRSFVVYQVPTINITSPAQGASITTTPINVAFDYSDQSGAQSDASIAVTDSNGAVVFTKNIGANTSYSITVAEFAPVNGETYAIAVQASSTSTLQASASVSVTMAFVPPAQGTLGIETDDTTHYVALILGAQEPAQGEVAAETLTLIRVTNGEEVTLTSGSVPGTSFVDMNAPLNTAYTYRLVSVANSGAIASVTFDNSVSSIDAMLQYGNDHQIAGRYDPVTSFDFDRPEKELITFWGRLDPVVFDSKAVSEEREYSFVILGSDISKLRDFMRNYDGNGVFRSLTGDVMHVSVSISGDTTMSNDRHTGIKLKMRRIDGDAL